MVRLGLILGLMAIIGAVISGLAAMKVYDQELSIGRIALARAVDTHAGLVQERAERTRTAGPCRGRAVPLPVGRSANALQPLRASIYAFRTDFVVASWIARVPAADFGRVQNELKAAGFPNPVLRNADDSPLNPAAVRDPASVVMDASPSTTRTSPLSAAFWTIIPWSGRCWRGRRKRGKPVSSDPLILLRPKQRPDGHRAGCAREGGRRRRHRRLPDHSYRLAPLMLANDELSLFSVALRDPRNASNNLSADTEGNVSTVPLLT